MRKHLILLGWLLIPFSTAYAQLLHERNYNPSPNYTRIGSSVPDGQGNILYSGVNLVGFNTYQQTLLLAKPDSDTLWTKKTPYVFDSNESVLQGLPDGGFLSGGNMEINNLRTLALQRLDLNGATILTKNYAPVFSAVRTMLVLPGKDYLLGGFYGPGNGFSFLRTDSLGNIKWHKDYSWSRNSETPVDMKFTADGNILVLGQNKYPVNSFHPKLMLINQNGDSLLGRQLIITGFNRNEVVRYNENSITALSGGGFLFTADVDTTSAFHPPNGSSLLGMVVKVDANLNIVWKYVHRTPTVDELNFTKSWELSDGSVLVLSYRSRPITNGFALYRFNQVGQLINIYPFASSICTNSLVSNTLDVLNDSTFMVGGVCLDGTNRAMYIATVKIPNLPPVLPVITAVKPELSTHQPLGQSYPNPAQYQTIIPYHLPNSIRNAKILITDITGREVGSYNLKVNQKQGSLPVNLSKLSNGLYLYSLVVDGKPVATKKLAVAR